MRPSPVVEIEHFRQRRIELLRRYGGVDEDPEAVPPSDQCARNPPGAAAPGAADTDRRTSRLAVRRRRGPSSVRPLPEHRPGWKSSSARASSMELVRIPAGDFVMGDPLGLSRRTAAGNRENRSAVLDRQPAK